MLAYSLHKYAIREIQQSSMITFLFQLFLIKYIHISLLRLLGEQINLKYIEIEINNASNSLFSLLNTHNRTYNGDNRDGHNIASLIVSVLDYRKH